MQLPAIIVSALAIINLAPRKQAEFGDEWKATQTSLFSSNQKTLGFAETRKLLQGLDAILSLRCNREETEVKLLARKLAGLSVPKVECDLNALEQILLMAKQLNEQLEPNISPDSDQSRPKSNAILYLEHLQDEHLKLCQKNLNSNLDAAVAMTSREDRAGLKLLVEKLGRLKESPPPQTLIQKAADFFVARVGSEFIKKLLNKKFAVKCEEEFVNQVGGLCDRVKANFQEVLNIYDRLKNLLPARQQDSTKSDWIEDVNTCIVVDSNIPSIKAEIHKYIMSKYSKPSILSAIKARF